MKKEALQKKTKKELVELALKKGIKSVNALKKDEIIKKLVKSGASSKTAAKRTAAKTAGKKSAVKKPVKSAAKKTTAASKKKTVTRKKTVSGSAASKRISKAIKEGAQVLSQPSETLTDNVAVNKEKIEESKFYLGKQVAVIEEPLDFPAAYSDHKIVALVRDPWWIYSYWELQQHKCEEVEQTIIADGDNVDSYALRVYDITNVDFNGHNANGFFDIRLSGMNNSWYINVGQPDRSWVVEIGILTGKGKFYCLARSNMVSTPRSAPSNVVDEQWLSIEEDFWRLFGVAGGFGIGRSSLEMKQMFESRLQQELSSGAMSSLFSSQALLERKQRNFWLMADCELVVYGATDPRAKLTVQGKPVSLREDGTFTLRFALPDGNQNIPIEAVSPDKVETKSITFDVNRATETFNL